MEQSASEHGVAKLTVYQLLASTMVDEVSWIQQKIGNYYNTSRWSNQRGDLKRQTAAYYSAVGHMSKAIGHYFPDPLNDVHQTLAEMFTLSSVLSHKTIDRHESPSDASQSPE